MLFFFLGVRRRPFVCSLSVVSMCAQKTHAAGLRPKGPRGMKFGSCRESLTRERILNEYFKFGKHPLSFCDIRSFVLTGFPFGSRFERGGVLKSAK